MKRILLFWGSMVLVGMMGMVATSVAHAQTAVPTTVIVTPAPTTTTTGITPVAVSGDEYTALQGVIQSVQTIIDQDASTLTPQEAGELFDIISTVQDILGEIVPNSVSTPLH